MRAEFPLAALGPGDPLPTLREGWNAVLQAGRDALVPPDGPAGPHYSDGWTPQSVVLVMNATGAALPAFAPVKLGTPLIDPRVEPHLARETPCFTGAVPGSYTDPFAILLEPAAPGATVRGAVLGVICCPLTVNTEGDAWAGPAAASGATGGTGSLVSLTAGGPAKIIWQSAPTGTVTALVLLQGDMGGGSSPPPPPPPPCTCEITVEQDSGGTPVPDVETVQFDHNYFAVTSPLAGTALVTSPAQTPHYVLAGPGSGTGSAAPGWRQLVLADIPDLSSLYVTPSQLTTDLAPYLTSATAAATYIPQSQLGVAGGVATLTAGGVLTASQIPSTVVLTTGTYSDPSWITGIAASILTGSSLPSTITGSSLTTLGTITSGNWHGNVIPSQYGGTGVNNGTNTLTLGGNLTTSGAYPVVLTATSSTGVTLPTSGTLVGSADVGTVSNTMLAGSIANGKLANSSVTIGTTAVALGATVATFAGMTLTAPTFTTPALGTPASGNLANCTFPTLNQSTTGQAGTVATIGGLITNGTNVTITGSGTSASPYTISASGVLASDPWMPAPTGLTATGETGTTVSLSWTGVTGAAAYKVWYATAATGAWTQFGSAVSGTTATVTGLSPSTGYYFTVSSQDAAGNGLNACSPIYAATTSNLTYHVFTASGTYSPASSATGCSILVVGGGGGGGGSLGGGGGAGGYNLQTGVSITGGTSYTVVVGAGGTGSASASANGNSGGTSSVIGGAVNVSVPGGGGGGTHFESTMTNGSAGGCGGGAGGANSLVGGTGSAGGNGGAASNTVNWSSAGGGGGLSAAGGAGTTAHGGNGGAGMTFFSGAYGPYGGGGGAALADSTGKAVGGIGTGGSGGGGNGSNGSAAAGNGTANTGGGGGGGSLPSANPGSGGSGIVIIFGPS